MRFRLLLLATLMTVYAAVGPCAIAQTAAELQHLQDPRHYDATRTGEVVDLGPLWLFQEGDDPAWAAKDFDDSKWQTINTNKSMGRMFLNMGRIEQARVYLERTLLLNPDDRRAQELLERATPEYDGLPKRLVRRLQRHQNRWERRRDPGKP